MQKQIIALVIYIHVSYTADEQFSWAQIFDGFNLSGADTHEIKPTERSNNYARRSGKSAPAADDRENSREVCCIAVEMEPGTVIGHKPQEGVTCALRCIVTGR